MRIIIFCLGLAVAFIAGWHLSPESDESPAPAIHAPPSKPLARMAAKPPGKPSAETAPTITAQLEAAFLSGSIGYSELRALFGALGSLSTQSLPEFTAFFRDRSMEKEQLLLWRLFFSAWGEFDADGAIAFIDSRFEESGARRFFYAAVIDTWKNRSMDEAFEFALANFEPSKRDESAPASHLAIDYLRSLAEKEPKKALALAMRLNDAEFVLDLTARRISQLAASDRNTALDAIESLTGETHFHAASQFVVEWAKSDPSGAADWLSTHFDERYNLHVLGQIARSYVQSDPAGAMTWIEGLSQFPDQSELLAEAIKAWAELDPQGSADWLSLSADSPEYDSATIALSYQLARERPQEVIEQWVTKVADQQRADALLAEVSSDWQRSDPEEFAAWIHQTSALSDEVKQRLLARESPAAQAGSGGSGEAQLRRGDTGVDQGRDR